MPPPITWLKHIAKQEPQTSAETSSSLQPEELLLRIYSLQGTNPGQETLYNHFSGTFHISAHLLSEEWHHLQ